jgi:phosphomannomutase
VEPWVEHVLTFIDLEKLKPLKIAVDAGNGMAGKIFPEIEPYLPYEINELYFELDGTFPNHIANPLILENLADLQKAVTQNKCDAGIAFDGDGDRAVIIDEFGVPISGSILTALLAKYFLEKNAGATVLYNAICGKVVPETIEAAGGKAIRTRVGHSFIKNDMRKYGAVLAGEHSGHYYFRDNFMADSGLIAAMMAMFILSIDGRPLSKMVAGLRKKYIQIEETNLEVKDKQAVINKAEEVFADEKQDLLDGLTVNFPDGWFNIRPSNTEPLLRLNAEAISKDRLDKIVSKITNIIT